MATLTNYRLAPPRSALIQIVGRLPTAVLRSPAEVGSNAWFVGHGFAFIQERCQSACHSTHDLIERRRRLGSLESVGTCVIDSRRLRGIRLPLLLQCVLCVLVLLGLQVAVVPQRLPLLPHTRLPNILRALGTGLLRRDICCCRRIPGLGTRLLRCPCAIGRDRCGTSTGRICRPRRRIRPGLGRSTRRVPGSRDNVLLLLRGKFDLRDFAWGVSALALSNWRQNSA